MPYGEKGHLMSVTPERLYLMQVVERVTPRAPVVCYLVQMSDGTNVLIDTGLPETIPPGIEVVRMGSVVDQLAQIGLQPADVDVLVCTHLDVDHSGYHSAFPNAEFVIQRRHYEAAQQSPRFAMTRGEWDRPEIRWRFVEGDTELFPGFMLLATDGHCVGHQSVLLRLPQTGAVLLAIDAVREEHSFTPEAQAQVPPDDDPAAWSASVRQLIDVAQREAAALVIFGHDSAQWDNLKKLPDCYG